MGSGISFLLMTDDIDCVLWSFQVNLIHFIGPQGSIVYYFLLTKHGIEQTIEEGKIIRRIEEKSEIKMMLMGSNENKVVWLWEREEKEELLKRINCIVWKVKAYSYNVVSGE